MSSFSNSVSFLNLLAPGSAITSSVPGGGYASFNGTSMATPHVAGAWAILKQAIAQRDGFASADVAAVDRPAHYRRAKRCGQTAHPGEPGDPHGAAAGDRHAAAKPDDLRRPDGDPQRGGDGSVVDLSVVYRPQRDHDLPDCRRHVEHLHHSAPDQYHQLLGAGVECLRQRQLSDRNDHRGNDPGVRRPAIEPHHRGRVGRVFHRPGGIDAAADLSLAGVVERRIDLDEPVRRRRRTAVPARRR